MDENSHKKPRTLIVEDDPGHQRLIELYLKRAGCVCDFAFDGKSGLKKATAEDYDIIFMDLNIPEMDGFMVATLLREQGNQTPMVAVTALEIEGVKRKANMVGYNDFLAKPFEQSAIVALLEKYFPGHIQR